MLRGENSTFKLVRCDDDAGWHEQRKKGVGGSDVAAIIGISPWRTPAEVWLEKTGRAEPQDISDRPHVQRGVELEAFVGEQFKKRHPELMVARVNAVAQSIERPWAQASLDYRVQERVRALHGVLEIKTSRNDAGWADGVPDYYLTQVLHYLSVTGYDFAWVAVQFDSDFLWEYREYFIERDEDDIAAIDKAVDTFWRDFVLADQMPVLVGTAGEARGLTQMYAEPKRESITVLDHETLQLVSDYQDAAMREKSAKDDKQKATTLLMERIGDSRTLFTDTSKVTWVRGEGERFDLKRFKADHPDLAKNYIKKYKRNGGLRVTDLKQ